MQKGFYQRPSGLYAPGEKPPTAIDFFAGCGGFSLGFIQAGFEVVAAVEWDPYAAITYMCNLGSYPIDIHFTSKEEEERLSKALELELKRYRDKQTGIYSRGIFSGSGWISGHPEAYPVRHFWFGDVRKINGKEMLDVLGMKPGEVDAVIGGPPCQGFSTAGKREVMDPRNSLVFDFARLILEIQPKFFVMENVPGILSMVTPEGIPVVDAFCKVLADGGFAAYDALKKTLLSTSGAGAALKGQKEIEDEPEEKELEMQQLALF